MWNYEKRLQYPINITTPNAKIAQIIMSQYGGPDGEMGASMRYLSQRYSMPGQTCMWRAYGYWNGRIGASGNGRIHRPTAHQRLKCRRT